MGLFTRLGTMFTKPARAPHTRSGGSLPVHNDAETPPPKDGATMLRERLEAEARAQSMRQNGSATALAEPAPEIETRPVRVADREDQSDPRAKPGALRSKQDMIDDLRRNYEEVVALVRKVDDHLDRQAERSEAILAIGRRIDETLPTLRDGPALVQESVERLRSDIVGAIGDAAAGDAERATKINSALDRLAADVAESGRTQSTLTSTMANFRETLGDIAKSTDRTGDVLEQIDQRRAEREDELTKMLTTSRTWMVVALILSLGMAGLAVAVAMWGAFSG